MRKIARKNTRIETDVEDSPSRRYQRDVNSDHLRYIVDLDDSTPDFRDKVTVLSDGSGKQRIAHNMPFTPKGIVQARLVSDASTPSSVWEYQEPDSRFIYLRTNAPKGAKITVVVSKV